MDHVLADAMFRASPTYAVVRIEDLPAPQRSTLARIAGGEGAAAVLVPATGDGGTGVKLIDRDTVELLDALRRPGPLPEHVRPDDDLVRLLLDGIVEVEVGGIFRSGVDAHAALGTAAAGSPVATGGRLARLSALALQRAQRMAISDPDRLAMKLYGFNRRPVSWAAKRTWPDRHAVLSALHGHAALTPTYRLRAPGSSSAAWITWTAVADGWSGPDAGTHKLYVSPAPDDLPRAFAAMVPHILRRRPPVLKVGADAYGLLRPDKMVLYFEDLRSLTTFADAVSPLLAGCEPHGVPFTAEIAGDGLLSWGLDPPRSSLGSVTGRDSWRSWLAKKLARAMIEAERGKAAESGVQPWRFALRRIGLEGVDTESWRAEPDIWQRTGKARDGAD